jgi:hypothetical protein
LKVSFSYGQKVEKAQLGGGTIINSGGAKSKGICTLLMETGPSVTAISEQAPTSMTAQESFPDLSDLSSSTYQRIRR